MEELQLTLTPARVDQRNFGLMLSNWRVGQVINALVVDRMPSGGMLLSAGGREFVTPMDLPVQPGNRLQLEVQKIAPQLVLKAFLPDATAGSGKTQSAPSSNPLVSADTRVANTATLLSTIAASPPLRAFISQSPALTALFASLTGQALPSSLLSSGTLAQAVAQSGLLTETNLAAGRDARAKGSAKTQLTLIQRMLGEMTTAGLQPESRASISSLSDLTNAALANLGQQQLTSIPQDGGSQRWVFSLPLELSAGFTDLSMTVERDKIGAQGSSDDEEWRVHLQLELPSAGPIKAVVSMKGSDISIVLQSQAASVREVFEQTFSDLRNRLIISDFRVKRLVAEPVMASPPPLDPSSGFKASA
ncbi:flagellar hook-length control protein FliK [Luminiphilus sp.]|nr:flagellar hook-length control protein FliK [Luminiphilus sp.]